MGYGDIYPVTNIGKMISMVSSIFGIAVIALPSGIVTAGFMEEINGAVKESGKKEEEKADGPDKAEESDEKNKRISLRHDI